MRRKNRTIRYLTGICFFALIVVRTFTFNAFTAEKADGSGKFDDMIKEAEMLREKDDLSGAKENYVKVYEDAKKEGLPEYRKKARKAILSIKKQEHRNSAAEKKELKRKRKEEEKIQRDLKRIEREKAQQEEASRKEKNRLLAKQVKRTYKEGMELYRKDEYKAAEEKFRQVQNEYPGYLRTEYFLERIPQDTERRDEIEKKRQERERKKREAVLKKQQQHLLRKEVKEKYKQARKLYRSGKDEEALAIFVEVQGMIPGYSKTEHYIRRIVAADNDDKPLKENSENK